MLFLNLKKDYDKGKIIKMSITICIKQSEDIKERLNIKLSGIEYDQKFVFMRWF